MEFFAQSFTFVGILQQITDGAVQRIRTGFEGFFIYGHYRSLAHEVFGIFELVTSGQQGVRHHHAGLPLHSQLGQCICTGARYHHICGTSVYVHGLQEFLDI